MAFFFDWDWAAAEREWTLADSLPSGALPTQERVSHSMGRWVLGGPAEALRIVRTLRALDPLTVSYAVLEADYLLYSGQLEAAAALYQKTIDDEPTPDALFGLAEVRHKQGRFDEALDVRRRAHQLAGDDWLLDAFKDARGEEGYRSIDRTARRTGARHAARTPAPRPTSRRSTLPGRMRGSATGRRRSATSTRHSPSARRGWSFSRWTPHGTVSATIRASPRQSGASVFLDGPARATFGCIFGPVRLHSGGHMKPRLVVTVLLLGMIGAGQPLFACGEKFRVGIRGTRFQRPPAARTAASILIYANPALNLSRALAGVPVDDTLRKAGYRPTTVRSPKEFQTALDRGGWDLVLLDLADSSTAIARSPVANPPVVLPVVFNASKAELAAAKKQHARVLKGPVKSQSLVDAVDDALAEKPPTQNKINSNSGL